MHTSQSISLAILHINVLKMRKFSWPATLTDTNEMHLPHPPPYPAAATA